MDTRLTTAMRMENGVETAMRKQIDELSRMTIGQCCFDILRIQISPRSDDHFFEPTANEQFPPMQKAQVTRA